MVPVPARLAVPDAAAVDALGLPRRARAGAVHHGAQREIPRLPLRHPVHRAVRAVRVAGGFDSSAVLSARLHVSRALYSLNPIVGVIDGFRWAIGGASEPLYCAGAGGVGGGDGVFPVAGRVVLPQDGTHLRGRDLKPPPGLPSPLPSPLPCRPFPGPRPCPPSSGSSRRSAHASTTASRAASSTRAASGRCTPISGADGAADA